MIRFESKAGSSVNMVEHDAKQMLELMEHSITVPGAILAEDIGKYLKNLQAAVRAETSQHELGDNLIKANSPAEAIALEQTQYEHERPITMSTRAYPLIELLEKAQDQQESLMWDHDHSIV